MTLFEQLSYRKLIHNTTPQTEELLNKEKITFYAGFDPTGDSLHIGHLVPLLVMKHLQQAGHKPLALVGTATGMVGDPSGKSNERLLLNKETLQHNHDCLKKQIKKYLDFDSDKEEVAIIVNNYDWFKNTTFLDFIRDTGKLITINYMMSKESVKKRIESEQGISFSEFTYQLIQAYDFLYLFENYNCKMQIGGSDQWGNITTGTELIRKKLNQETYAFTTPLLTKSDGGKFGKTEGGNIWLDPKKTTPYQFYQFWINASDTDAKEWIKIFTFLSPDEIDNIIAKHDKTPNQRLLQQTLASEVTSFIHSRDQVDKAVNASKILFYDSNPNTLYEIDESTFEQIIPSLQSYDLKNDKSDELTIVDILANKKICSSKGEARKMIRNGGIYINKEKVEDFNFNIEHTKRLFGKYILLQKGKKNYFILSF